MPGCGKTTMGKSLAEICNTSFHDLDRLIEKVAQRAVPEIFNQNGEEYFRALERDTLVNFSKTHSLKVLATGGGTPCFHNNMTFMNQFGITIFLDQPVDVLYERLLADRSRPLFSNLSPKEFRIKLESMYAQRRRYYTMANIITSLTEADKVATLLSIQND